MSAHPKSAKARHVCACGREAFRYGPGGWECHRCHKANINAQGWLSDQRILGLRRRQILQQIETTNRKEQQYAS